MPELLFSGMGRCCIKESGTTTLSWPVRIATPHNKTI